MNRPETIPLQSGYTPNNPPPGVFQTTVVQVQREMPKDHIVWSLCCFVYSNPFCLGLAALIYSIKARDKKVIGDIEGARAHGSTARVLNLIATVIFCVMILIFIITISVVAGQASNSYYSYSDRYPYNGDAGCRG